MRNLMAVLLAAIALPGQEKPAEAKAAVSQQPLEAVIIPVKTLSGDSFNRLAQMLGVFNVRHHADEKLRTILVYGPPDVVAQMRRVVEDLDRPGSEAAIGRNIEMTLAFLRCSDKPQADSPPLPPDLESAARQLRTATRCQHVELWEIVPLRLQEGRTTEQSLRLPGSLPDNPGAFAKADLSILPEAVFQKDAGKSVRFAHLKVHLRIPYSTSIKTPGGQGQNPLISTQFNYVDLALNTAGDFKEGQKTILGKLSGLEDEATFVVISLKVLD
jgi:hypothetical protein